MSEPETVEAVVGESERRSVSPENQFKRSIYGLPVNVIVSIGQKQLSVAELLQLKPDTIIPLTAKIEDPIELLVEDRLIAHGELIELEDGAIGVRLTQIEEQDDAEHLAGGCAHNCAPRPLGDRFGSVCQHRPRIRAGQPRLGR